MAPLSKAKKAKAAKAQAAQVLQPESEFHLDAVGEDVTMEDLFAPFAGMAGLEDAPLPPAAATGTAVDAERAAAEAQKLLPESEFHIGAVSEEVTYDDLLNPLQSSKGLGSLRKQLIKVSEREAVPEPASEVKRGKEVREAQFQSTSKHLQRWGPQLREMARADQVVLGLDPVDPQQTTGDLVGTFSAQDDFEKELEEATKIAGATEADMKANGQLPMNPRIRDEQQTRHAARLKALILREKIASKRVGKIKSKAYRKIHRNSEKKEREVLLERLEHENPELAKTLRHEYEKKHAEMRLMRQRNARKKWATTMQRFAKNDQTAHKEISRQAQNQRDEETALRRAIKGRNPDEGDDSDVDLSGDEDDEGEGTAAQRTIERAKQLTIDQVKGLADGTDDLPTSGILGMGFMRQAIQRKREAAKGEAQEALKELQKLGRTLDDARAVDPSDKADSDDETQKIEGAESKDELKLPAAAKTFSSAELAEARAQVEAIMEDDGGPQFSVSGPVSVKGVQAQESLPGPRKGTKRKATKKKSAAQEQVAVKNPFLQEEGEEDKVQTEVHSMPAESITGSAPASSSGQQRAGTKRRKAMKGYKITADEDQEGQAGSAGGAAAKPLPGAAQSIFADLTEAEKEQRELVRTTFVEGTQEEDFQDEQDARLDDAAEKARKATEGLMGWGSWTGDGVKPRKSRAQHEAEAKAAKELASRGGQKERHSVFQPYDGKGADKSKFFVDSVPFEYKNAEYYNQQLKMPTGPEWQTLPNHVNRIKPKFFAKVGAIVPPLQHVKDFETDKQREIMNVWASSKQPKRMKARL